MRGCTSFGVHDEHVVFTISLHTLHWLPLSSLSAHNVATERGERGLDILEDSL